MADSLLRGDLAAWTGAVLASLVVLALVLRVMARQRGPRRPIDIRRHEEALENFRLRHAQGPPKPPGAE